MVNKIYNNYNFHKHTFCIWKEVMADEINDMKVSYKSQSGSQYIFTKLGLYRISNHWGRVADCHWRLLPLLQFKSQLSVIGFAHWSDFYSYNDTSKLFFIRVNLATNNVNFYHKESSKSDEKIVLRNAKETAKTLKTIKQILTETDWAKHLRYYNFEALKKEIIYNLITTDKSFLEIKKAFLGY